MEINFIPIDNYTPIYFHILLIICLILFFHSIIYKINDKENLLLIRMFGPFTLMFVILYMGLRPINEIFGDMITYNFQFEYYTRGYEIVKTKDVLFHFFMKFCASFMTANFFFLISAVLYVYPLYVVSKKWFKQYWFYAFLMLVGSFSFWGFGTNGIRNGIATSLFLLAISKDKLFYRILILFIAISFHKSLLLPTLAYVGTLVYNKPKPYILFWLCSIPVSVVLGTALEAFLAGFIEDDRASYLSDQTTGGFRWDFLVYSATGVFAGWYYIFKKNYEDVLYTRLFNIYLFCNAIWVLVIRANYTNRFAYLSWFMLAIIIIYPLLKEKLITRQYFKMGIILLMYMSFTYIMQIFMNSNA